mgnify:FL=1|tara:strand:+ start:241 stop:438 length:198 start_codon:yes stop_codon:yes gene_type:complete
MLIEKFFAHISNWKMAWFGLIFLGSIINAVLQKSSLVGDSPYVSVFAFGAGALIGLVAKIRGAWL